MGADWLSVSVAADWLSVSLGTDWLSVSVGADWLSVSVGTDWLGVSLGADWLSILPALLPSVSRGSGGSPCPSAPPYRDIHKPPMSRHTRLFHNPPPCRDILPMALHP